MANNDKNEGNAEERVRAHAAKIAAICETFLKALKAFENDCASELEKKVTSVAAMQDPEDLIPALRRTADIEVAASIAEMLQDLVTRGLPRIIAFAAATTLAEARATAGSAAVAEAFPEAEGDVVAIAGFGQRGGEA